MAITNAIVPYGNYLYKDPMKMLLIATEKNGNYICFHLDKTNN